MTSGRWVDVGFQLRMRLCSKRVVVGGWGGGRAAEGGWLTG